MELLSAGLRVRVFVDVAAVLEQVVGIVDVDIFNVDIVAVPKSLFCIRNRDTPQHYAVKLTKHFRGFDYGVGHDDISRVPERGARTRRECTFPYAESVSVPERIFALKAAMHGIDVATAFQG